MRIYNISSEPPNISTVSIREAYYGGLSSNHIYHVSYRGSLYSVS